MSASIESIKKEIEEIRRPSGTKTNPARSCKDLYLCNKGKKDGFYWIDPNQGCSDDAIMVFCNFTAEGQTCVYPDKDSGKVEKRNWKRSSDEDVYFSDLEGGKMISYNNVGKVQLTFLRLLSESGKQNFTVTCKNFIAWFDKKNNHHDKSIILQGDNEQEFSPGSNKLKIVRDGCKMSGNKEEKTVFEIETEKLSQLPIVDFAPRDWNSKSEYGFEAGPLCFS